MLFKCRHVQIAKNARGTHEDTEASHSAECEACSVIQHKVWTLLFVRSRRTVTYYLIRCLTTINSSGCEACAQRTLSSTSDPGKARPAISRPGRGHDTPR